MFSHFSAIFEPVCAHFAPSADFLAGRKIIFLPSLVDVFSQETLSLFLFLLIISLLRGFSLNARECVKTK